MSSLQPNFGDIEFGYASAEKEGAENPDLLLSGFLDDSRLTEKALAPSGTFVFLGYKGSGKTALAERARLLADDQSDLFVTATTLQQFSYADFKSVAGGSGDSQNRYPTAWGWLLLVQLINSLQQDEGGRASSPVEYRRAVDGLEAIGLEASPELGRLVATSSKKAFKAAVPKFLEYMSEQASATQDLQMGQLVRALERAALQFRTKSRHIVFLDGLDAIVTQRELQFQSLAALMHESDRLNSSFRRAGQPFKFVVLCRTDIFERLPGSNINKVRQDSAVNLSWFDTPGNPDQSKLLRMVNLRASVSLRRRVNLFDEFLPAKIEGRAPRTVLLDHTRHTPRDLVQLLRKIQGAGESTGQVSSAQVRDGLRAYSIEYFIPELKDELAGYLDARQIDSAVMLLTAIRKQRITLTDLEQKAKELTLGSIDLRALIRALFDASCIGTIEEAAGNRPLYTFKYRNPTATALPDQTFWLHPGALKGLNIELRHPRVRPPRSRPRKR